MPGHYKLEQNLYKKMANISFGKFVKLKYFEMTG
jgi:hypothetical protein